MNEAYLLQWATKTNDFIYFFSLTDVNLKNNDFGEIHDMSKIKIKTFYEFSVKASSIKLEL